MIYVVLVRAWGEATGYPVIAYEDRAEAHAYMAAGLRREVVPIPLIEATDGE